MNNSIYCKGEFVTILFVCSLISARSGWLLLYNVKFLPLSLQLHQMPPPDSWCIRVQCIGTVTLLRVLPVREKMKPTEGRKTKGGNHRVLHSSFSHPWNLISTSSFPLFENGEFMQNLLHVWHKLCLSRVYAHWPYKHTTHTHPEGVIAHTLHGQDAQNMCTNNTQCMHHAHNPNTTLYIHTHTYHAYTQNTYSTPQTKHYSTQHATSLHWCTAYTLQTIKHIQYTLETKCVLYDTSNTMLVQDSYMVTGINACMSLHASCTHRCSYHTYTPLDAHTICRDNHGEHHSRYRTQHQQAQSHTEGKAAH